MLLTCPSLTVQMARGGGGRERAPYCVTATAALFRSAGRVGACRISIATAKKQIQARIRLDIPQKLKCKCKAPMQRIQSP